MSKLKFYGGVNCIGGNIVLLEDKNTRILIDFGMSFSNENKYYSDFLKNRQGNGIRDHLSLNLIPKIPGLYREDLLNIEKADELMKELGLRGKYLFKSDLESYEKYIEENNRPYIDAILISHVHLDHCGYIWMVGKDIPIYLSDVSVQFLNIIDEISKNNKLSIVKYRILDRASSGYFKGEKKIKKSNTPLPRNILEYHDETEFTIGNLKITPYYVDHSILGASAFLIVDSDNKKIFYTGDFRFHGRQTNLTKKFKQAMTDLRPDVMITEGTKITETKRDDEIEVENKIYEIAKNTNKLIFITFAWKDITRFQTVRNVCARTGRKFIIPGKMAYLLRKMKSYLDFNFSDPLTDPYILVYLPRKGGMIYLKTDYSYNKLDVGLNPDWTNSPNIEIYENGIKAYEIHENQSKYIVYLNDYMLNEIIDINPSAGALYIRALSEPFDLEGEIDEQRIKNWLKFFKINLPSSEIINIHASGHISGIELKKFISLVKPIKLFPIHTQHPEEFSKFKGVITNIEVGKEYFV
ncbi:MAG: MBL fold metallo-hydrolase [Candidatus Helarchaeota archaeon]